MTRQTLIPLYESFQEIENMVWALYVVTFLLIAVGMQDFPPIDNKEVSTRTMDYNLEPADLIAHPELSVPLALVIPNSDSPYTAEHTAIIFNKATHDSDRIDEHVSLNIIHN